jgi:outer membrane protein assembly complex protein YaeT
LAGVVWPRLLACVLLAQTASAQPPNNSTSIGHTILRVEYKPELQPLPEGELDRLVPLYVGAPLRAENVREAIHKLFATGRYSDVSIDSTLTDEGVIVQIDTEPAYFISGVQVEGENEPPNKAQLVAATRLELGAPFAQEDLAPAIENMQERLKANGFYNAQIQTTVARDDQTEEVNIRFTIDTGPRARFEGVQFSGEFDKSEERLIRTTGWRRHFAFITLPGWRPVTDNLVVTGVAGIRRSFEASNRLRAVVRLDERKYDGSTNTVTPAITIDTGPIIEVKAVGAKISDSKLRQLIPVFQEHAVDRGLLIEGRRNLLEYFQSQGYFNAMVQFDDQAPIDQRLIVYSIDRGVRNRLVKIEIHGNRFFDTSTLTERMAIRSASAIRYRNGRFSQRLLDRDLDVIRDLYRSNGFRDVLVTGQVTEITGGRSAGELAASIEIMEGPQWRVASLDLTGVPDSDRDTLMAMLQSTPGQAFSESSVASDRDAILSHYFNNGFPDATFDWTQSDGPEQYQVALRFVVTTGVPQYVRAVLIRGLQITNKKLVSDRISLKPGDPISQSEISRSQQRLYDLGIFSKVQTAVQNSDNPEESKFVIFHMDEARKYSLNMGVGAEIARIGGGTTTFDDPAGVTGFSPRVSVGISRINFLGLGHTVSLQTRVSTLEQRALLSYLAPQFKGRENTSVIFSALFDNSRDVRTFTARRWEGSVQISQRLTRASTFQARYVFRKVNIDENTLKISPGLIPLLSQPVRVGSVSVTYLLDRRDDPVNSRRGFFNSVDVGYATKLLGSETDFVRFVLRNSTYHRIGKEMVLARNTQFGYIQRLGGLPQIPLAERFFSGGSSSQRAFPDNQAGPRDLETGFPLGGDALLFNQTELRFPLIGDNVGGVLFHDIGNVYSDIRNISMRFRQRNLQDFDYGVQGMGFGIRYKTPVGPVRLDLSYSPNAPRFFGFSGTRDELLAGQGTLTNQRINVFQFHFSLGQTF